MEFLFFFQSGHYEHLILECNEAVVAHVPVCSTVGFSLPFAIRPFQLCQSLESFCVVEGKHTIAKAIIRVASSVATAGDNF